VEVYTAELRQIFSDIDVDGSGSMTIQEFKERLNGESMRVYFASMELDTSDLHLR